MNFKRTFTDGQRGFPMAPMVDIMFLLLIFFMVATIYAQWETKMGITIPSAETGERGEREQGEIIINVDSDGTIVINNQEMTKKRLQTLLARIHKADRDQPVIIRADAKTDHSDVIDVLDICRKVDIWNVAFSTLPEGNKSGN